MPECKEEAACVTTHPDRLTEIYNENFLGRSLLEALDMGLARTLAKNPNTRTSVLVSLLRLVPEEVLTNPLCEFLNMSFPGLGWIPQSTRESLAGNTESAVVMAKLVEHGDEAVRKAVALNHKLSRSMAKRLSEDESGEVLVAVYMNGVTPDKESLLLKLASHKEEKARYFAAQKAELPPATLSRLVRDKSAVVRSGAAKNHCLKSHEFDRLSTDDEKIVRMSLLDNKALPENTMQNLLSDRDVDVSSLTRIIIINKK